MMQENKQLNYNDFQDIGPNWHFASDHGRATLPGVPQNDPGSGSRKNIELCQCCLQEINKQPIPFCQNTKELDFLGFGFPLYFSFLRCCILLLAINLFSYGIIDIYRAYTYNSQICSTSARLLASTPVDSTDETITCTSFMIETAQLNSALESQEVALRLIGFFAHMLGLLYVNDKQYTYLEYLDEKILRISQYSILMVGLPHTIKIQQKLKKFFKEGFQQIYIPKKIILIPSLQELESLKQKKKVIIQKKQKILKANPQANCQDLQSQITQLKRSIRQQVKRHDLQYKFDTLTSEKVIIILNTQKQRNDVLDQFKQFQKQHLTKFFGIQSNSIAMERAPEPREIIWENINYPKRKKTIRVIISWIVTIILIALVFVVFYFVLKLKAEQLSDVLHHYSQNPIKYADQRKNAIALVYIALIIIIFFNKFIMGLILHKFSEMQKHETSADLQFSYALKYALGMFFTTALMTLAVEAISFNNYFSHEYGVIEEETVMYFLNSFLVPAIWLVNPWHIFRWIKRKIYYGSTNFTQEQANKLMEEMPYDMGKRIAEIIKTMWFVFLYISLIPEGSLISIFGLILYYWVDRYNLFRKSSIITNVPANLPHYSLILLDFTLLLMPLGMLLFDSHIRKQYHPSTIAMIVIAVVYLVLPKDKILRTVIGQKFSLRLQPFKEVEYQFIQSYETLHPVIRESKLHRHLLNRSLSLNAKTQLKLYKMSNPEQSQILIRGNLDSTVQIEVKNDKK